MSRIRNQYTWPIFHRKQRKSQHEIPDFQTVSQTKKKNKNTEQVFITYFDQQ